MREEILSSSVVVGSEYIEMSWYSWLLWKLGNRRMVGEVLLHSYRSDAESRADLRDQLSCDASFRENFLLLIRRYWRYPVLQSGLLEISGLSVSDLSEVPTLYSLYDRIRMSIAFSGICGSRVKLRVLLEYLTYGNNVQTRHLRCAALFTTPFRSWLLRRYRCLPVSSGLRNELVRLCRFSASELSGM